MIRNYFKTSFRHIGKSGVLSILNITGLTLGLASILTLIFGVYVYWNGNATLRDQDRMYYLKSVSNDGSSYMQTTYPLLMEIVQRSTVIEAATHMQGWNAPWLKNGDVMIQENTQYVDSGFLEVFTLPLKYGQAEGALDDKYSVVLSEKASHNLFGEINPVGETILLDDSLQVTITGVLEQISGFSTVKAEVFLTTALLEDNKDFKEIANWYNSFSENYLKLKEGANLAHFEAEINEIVKLNYAEDSGVEKVKAVPFSQMSSEEDPLTETILTGAVATAIFVLLIILVNILNLNTSTMYDRNKEVAVRKIIGSTKKNLLIQFCIENLLVVFTSLILAGLIFFSFLLPGLNTTYGTKFGALSFNLGTDYPVILVAIALGTLISILAGTLPALRFITIPVAQAIKGKLSKADNNNFFRNLFITLQFALATFLICVAIVLNRQMNYMQNTSLGFNTQDVVEIHLNLDYENREVANTYFASLLKRLEDNPNVKAISTTQMIPSNYPRNYNSYYDPSTGNAVQMRHSAADAGYVKTFEIPVIEGRNFDERIAASEGTSLMINRKAMKALGWESIEGKQLKEKGGDEIYNVIGVMEDFHYQNMQQGIEPLLHWYGGEKNLGYNNYLSIKTHPGYTYQITSILQDEFSKIPAKRDFQYSFLRDLISEQYLFMDGIVKTVNFMAFLAIIISCLGMFGLITLLARRKVKEIGIKKVLGAGVLQIVLLLSKDFLKIVGLAFFIAFPLAWYISSSWLQNFAYRISTDWWMFAIGGLIVFLLTVLTIGIQSLKAAIANPIKSLRTE